MADQADADRTDDDTARNRWMAIQAARFAGVIMAMIGLLIVGERIAAPALAGYVLLAAGLIDVFFVPRVLARKWRTPRP